MTTVSVFHPGWHTPDLAIAAVARTGWRWLLFLSLLPVAAVAAADESEQLQPCADRSETRQLYFGDTHVHSAYSMDAAIQDTRNRPSDAYRFARGEEIGIQPYDRDGKALRRIRLDRPLDFNVVTDHAEMLGELSICSNPGVKGYYSLPCMIYRYVPQLSLFVLMGRASSGGDRFGFCGEGGEYCLEASRSPWQDIRRSADQANDRCFFTAFIGYEWTGNDRENIHRNIIFRNSTVPELPVSFYEESQPEGLWDRLQERCQSDCDLLIIPHNSNLSDGVMFPSPQQRPLTNNEAARRARLEPILEVIQHKGSSECWFGPGAEDELCAFEMLPYNLFSGRFFPGSAEAPSPGDGYARRVLLDGLRYAGLIGTNPYRMGFIGSTDTHLGTPGAVAEVATYPGHGGAGKTAKRDASGLADLLEYNPGGLAAVWAEENTREAVFLALRRRETYSTSGPRIRLRFFGGWDYRGDLCDSETLAAEGYGNGVPMGGIMRPGDSERQVPHFIVDALQDPGTERSPGMPLQRVQIIKGWVDESDRSQLKIYEVAGDADNGAGVDPASCEPYGEGYRRLCTVWKDPDFDPTVKAYYYARVVENPSCRWSAKACNAKAVDCRNPDAVPKELRNCCSPQHRRVIQERALSSPIWFDAPVF